MRKASFFMSIALVALVLLPAHGMFMQGESLPLERVIKNATAFIQENPKDPHGYYVLARIHYYAYFRQSDTLLVFTPERLGVSESERPTKATLPVLDDRYMGPRAVEEPNLASQALREHLAKALSTFETAVQMVPQRALYHHSLASLLEQASADAASRGLAPYSPERTPILTPEETRKIEQHLKFIEREKDVAALRAMGAKTAPLIVKALGQQPGAEVREALTLSLKNAWLERAIEHYRLAYMASARRDITGMERLSMVDVPLSQQAAERFMALVHQRTPTEPELALEAAMQRDIATLSSRGFAVTPIIFSLQDAKRLEDLLAPEADVEFDLDGDGIAERGGWVRPDTAILVWDPEHTGRITSGRQLFGSATWWMFCADGYQALNLLDDNRDGLLSGSELIGLSLWHDRNTNGISDPGEVTPLESTPVVALRTTWDGRVAPNDSLRSEQGVLLRNGNTQPSFDWITVR